jgi:hypothetical protein
VFPVWTLAFCSLMIAMAFSSSVFAEKIKLSLAMSNPSVQVVPSLAHTPSHDHGGHVVQLYTDDGFLIDVLSRFIGGALAVGDAAVVVATAGHRIELERRLSGRGIDTSKVGRKDVILCWTQARPYRDSW